MATHSSILAWRIPWTESLVGYSPQITKSWTQLSDFTFTFTFIQLICYTFSLSYVEFKFMYSANRRMFWILTWFWYLPANLFSFNSSIFGSAIVLAVVCLIVQSLSHVWLLAAPWAAARQASLSFNISQSLLKPCPLSRWCHPTISSSVVPFSSHLQSFPASRSFPMSQLFESGGQSIGASTSASVLPMNIQDWFPLGLTGWISLQSKGLSRVFSNTTVQKH